MTDYFGAPNQPASPGEWTPPAPAAPMPAWSGGGDGPRPPLPGPWPRRRPAPWLAGLVGALGGLLVSAGFGGLVSQLDGDGGRFVAGALAAAVIAAVVVLLDRAPAGPLRVAAITAAFSLAVLPMSLWLSTADGMSLKAMLILAVLAPTAAWAACFLVGGTRGRPVFLAGSLVGVWLLMCVIAVDTGSAFDEAAAAPAGRTTLAATAPFAASSLQAQVADRDGDGIPDEFDPDPDHNPLDDIDVDDDSGSGSATTPLDPAAFFPFFFGLSAAGTAVGVVSLLFGVAYLLAAVAFDRAGLPGAATPFQGVGIAASLVAIALLSGDLGDGGSALLALLLGAALVWTGAASGRRLSSWLGVVVAFSGAGGLVGAVVDDAAAEAALLLVLGVGVLAAAHSLLPGSPPDDDDGAGTLASAPGPAAPVAFVSPPAPDPSPDPSPWTPSPLAPPELPPG